MRKTVVTAVLSIFIGIIGTIIFQTIFQLGRFSEKGSQFQEKYSEAEKLIETQKRQVEQFKNQSLNGTLFRGSTIIWNSDIELSFDTLEQLRDQPAKTYQGKQGVLVVKEVKKNAPLINRNSIDFTATYTVNTKVK